MNKDTKKEIKEEVKKQLEKVLGDNEVLIIEKASNGYKIKCMDWERDEPKMVETLFKIEHNYDSYDRSKEYDKKEKEGISEMVSEILFWMGYDWDKWRKDNPELKWDNVGDHYEGNG